MRAVRKIVLAAILLMLCLHSGSTRADGECFIREQKDAIFIGNSKIVFAIDKKKGLILSLRAGRSGPDVLTSMKKNSDRALFSIFINDKIKKEIFKAALGRLADGRDQELSAAVPEVAADFARLTLKFKNVGRVNITVEVTIEVRSQSEVATMRIKVNNNSGGIVTAVVFPQIAGLRSKGRTYLAWPQGRGKIFRNPPSSFFRLLPYPAPASMQWFFYRLPDVGLYIAALDPHVDYKEFRFGLDRALDSSRGCSVTFWPFIEHTAEWRSPDVEVGLFNESWHAGAKRYREWLTREAKWVKKHPRWVAEMPAIACLLVKNKKGVKVNNYAEIAKRLAALNTAGISAMSVLGWHYNGYDTYYPDYKLIADAGGEKALRAAIADAHKAGGRVFFHINGQLACEKSKFFPKYGQYNRAVMVDGYSYRQTINRLKFQVMCPSTEVWRTKLAYYQEKLRNLGADGVWLDQIGCDPARLCFGDKHGHTTPANAFGPGYMRMLEEFGKIWRGEAPGPREKLGREGGTRIVTREPVFLIEGVVDAYGKYADVHGLVWEQELGCTKADAPELTRFTLPGRIIGLPAAGVKKNTIGEFGWAFVMGEPLLGGNEKTARILKIYAAAPECFFYGRFLDNLGVSKGSRQVRAGVLMSSDKKNIVLTFWNGSAKDFTGEVSFDLTRHSLTGAVEKIIDVENPGEPIKFKGRTVPAFSLSIPAGDIRVVKIILTR
jgi:hypothetical protein